MLHCKKIVSSCLQELLSLGGKLKKERTNTHCPQVLCPEIAAAKLASR